MIVLAVALVFNLPAMLQRAVPDYTVAMQKGIGAGDIQRKLNQGGTVKGQLADCTDGSVQLQQCGPAPAVSGITQWLNTPDGKPIDLASLRGKVVLIDFWAYSCINCQRAIGHVVDWYNRYRDDGFVVIGVHTPEYAFERVPTNVASGAAALHISYPIALDNDYKTWNNYQNLYWPAEYLIDANGTVRHTKFGEGDYDGTEKLIRQLLAAANPDARLPASSDSVDTTPQTTLTPETYLGVHRAGNYGGDGEYKSGSFGYPAALAADRFALRGRWTLDDQGATADSDDAAIALNYTAKAVYVVVGGTGTLTVTRDQQTTATPISGPRPCIRSRAVAVPTPRTAIGWTCGSAKACKCFRSRSGRRPSVGVRAPNAYRETRVAIPMTTDRARRAGDRLRIDDRTAAAEQRPRRLVAPRGARRQGRVRGGLRPHQGPGVRTGGSGVA